MFKKAPTKTETKVSEEEKISSPVIIIGSDEYKKGLTGACTLPDKRIVCVDRSGCIFLVNPDKLESSMRSQKVKTNIHANKINALTKNNIVVYDRKADSAFILNVNTGETRELDEIFAHEDICLAKLKVKDQEFLFVTHTDSNKIFIYELQQDKPVEELPRLDKPAQTITLSPIVRDVKRKINNLTIVDDKVIVGVGRSRKSELLQLAFENGEFIPMYFRRAEKTPFVCGNGNFLAINDKETLNICTTKDELKASEPSFQTFFSINTALGGVDHKAICAIHGTPIFCFIGTDNLQLNIFNCADKQMFSIFLPVHFKSSLSLSENGQLTYLSSDDQLVVLTCKNLFLMKEFLLNALKNLGLSKDIAILISSFFNTINFVEPVLSKEMLSHALAIAGIKYNKNAGELNEIKLADERKSAGASLFSWSKKSIKKTTEIAVKEMFEATSDAQRYRMALNFVKRHPDNPITPVLETLLPTLESVDVAKPRAKL